MGEMLTVAQKPAVEAADGPPLSILPQIWMVGTEHGLPREGLRIIGIDGPIAVRHRIGKNMIGTGVRGVVRISDSRTDRMRNTSAKDAVGEVLMSACSFHITLFKSTVAVGFL